MANERAQVLTDLKAKAAMAIASELGSIANVPPDDLLDALEPVFTLSEEITAKDWVYSLSFVVNQLFPKPDEGAWEDPEDWLDDNLPGVLGVLNDLSDEGDEPYEVDVKAVLRAITRLADMDTIAPPLWYRNAIPSRKPFQAASFYPIDAGTYAPGVTLLFGAGGAAKSFFVEDLYSAARKKSRNTPTYFVPLVEPDRPSNVTERQFADALEEIVSDLPDSNSEPFVFVDSFRIVLRTAPGLGKRGGLSPGFDLSVGSLNTLGQLLGLRFVLVINPSDAGLSAIETARMAEAISDGTISVIHLLSGSEAHGYTMRYAGRPNRLTRF
jgi:hypothetical protein